LNGVLLSVQPDLSIVFCDQLAKGRGLNEAAARFVFMFYVVNRAMRQMVNIREREGAESILTKGRIDSDEK